MSDFWKKYFPETEKFMNEVVVSIKWRKLEFLFSCIDTSDDTSILLNDEKETVKRIKGEYKIE